MIIAMMAEQMLIDMGASVVGPAQTITEALEVAGHAEIDLALLDVNVQGRRIDPVMQLLRERNIPVVLATGYGATALDVPRDVRVIEKPYTEDKLRAALVAASARPA
jgi:CheY-like chemotaxis protein